MRHRYRRSLAQAFCTLAGFGLFFLVIPGCNEEVKQDEKTGVPTVLKQSNDNMENFMKSKGAKKSK